jgi:hypothetical protein
MYREIMGHSRSSKGIAEPFVTVAHTDAYGITTPV